MEKKDKNPIRVDIAINKLPSLEDYFDSEIGEIPGAEDVLKKVLDIRKEKEENP